MRITTKPRFAIPFASLMSLAVVALIVPDTLGQTIFEPPYDGCYVWKEQWFEGDAIAEGNSNSGVFSIFAHGWAESARAEAQMMKNIYLGRPKTLAIDATIYRVGGAEIVGLFALVDVEKNARLDGTYCLREFVDTGLGWTTAVSLILTLAQEITESPIPYGSMAEALVAIDQANEFNLAREKFEDLLATGEAEEIHVQFQQTLGTGSHTIHVGMRTDVAAVVLGYGQGAAVGMVRTITISGMDAPTISINGPGSGTIGAPLTVQVLPDDANDDDVQYRIDWGDSQVSGWSELAPPGQWMSYSHTYTQAGTYSIKAQAMDADQMQSPWSTPVTITISTAETVSPPNTPCGPASRQVDESGTYTTGGAACSHGHSVEYRFDWGNQTYSTWGPATRSNSWSTVGIYCVRAQARCVTHPSVMSVWSGCLNVSVAAGGTTKLVKPDGTGDYPTIQAAINAASDDWTILLADGTFTGTGNRDLDYLGKVITVRSQSGNPNTCTIDCQGSAPQPHRGFRFHSGESSQCVLQGVTVKNAYMTGAQAYGGAVLCYSGSPTISNCVFSNNASQLGGGLTILGDSSPSIVDCVFTGNTDFGNTGGIFSQPDSGTVVVTRCSFFNNAGDAIQVYDRPATITACTLQGGGAYRGIYARQGASLTMDGCTVSEFGEGVAVWGDYQGSAHVSRCSFVGNGVGIASSHAAPITIEQSIVVFSTSGAGVRCETGGTATLTCSNVFENAGGDWVGCIADQYGTSGNFSADPLFCDPNAGNYRLYDTSPCAPAQQPACGLIGALDVGCSGAGWPPVLTNYDSWPDGVEPDHGGLDETLTFKVHYYDPEGTLPSKAEVWIDGQAHTITGSGSGADYSFSCLGSVIGQGGHSYHFYFEDAAYQSARLPASGEWAVIVSVPTSGPVAYWRCDEGSGTVLTDCSGNGNHAVILNPSWGDGILGGALYFNGTNARVEFNSPVRNEPPLTICAWVYLPTMPTGAPYILSNGGETGASYGFYLNVGNVASRWQFGSKSGAMDQGAALDTPASTGWSFLCWSWDGMLAADAVKLYVNGELKASVGPHSISHGAARNLRFGCTSGNQYHFNGALDDIRIYDRALDATEILNLYLCPGGSCQGDFNCDGVLDVDDVPHFVQALTAPAAYQAAHPDCDILRADLDADQAVDGRDIQLFIDALLAQ